MAVVAAVAVGHVYGADRLAPVDVADIDENSPDADDGLLLLWLAQDVGRLAADAGVDAPVAGDEFVCMLLAAAMRHGEAAAGADVVVGAGVAAEVAALVAVAAAAGKTLSGRR